MELTVLMVSFQVDLEQFFKKIHVIGKDSYMGKAGKLAQWPRRLPVLRPCIKLPILRTKVRTILLLRYYFSQPGLESKY